MLLQRIYFSTATNQSLPLHPPGQSQLTVTHTHIHWVCRAAPSWDALVALQPPYCAATVIRGGLKLTLTHKRREKNDPLRCFSVVSVEEPTCYLNKLLNRLYKKQKVPLGMWCARIICVYYTWTWLSRCAVTHGLRQRSWTPAGDHKISASMGCFNNGYG